MNLENQVNVGEIPCHCLDVECHGALEDLFEICTVGILLPFVAQGHDLDQNWILFSMVVLQMKGLMDINISMKLLRTT